jgi:ABC-type phosphate/phosphonate transport system substrate-binding protein
VQAAPFLDDSPTERFRRVSRTELRAGFVFARDRIDRARLSRALEQALGRPVTLVRHGTYADLAEAASQGRVDLAWMPPAAYVRARRSGSIRAIAALERDGSSGYRCALLARTGTFAAIGELDQARAAWVDPWSAAGYLVPRGMIVGHELLLTRAIRAERFFGSYDSALDALTVRTADIAGAFCTVDANDKIVSAGWSSVAPVRVLGISPPIPSDLLCTTGAIGRAEGDDIEGALVSANGAAVAQALGGTGLALAVPSRYDALAHALSGA